MIGIDVFPIKFFEVRLDMAVALNVLNEILRKEDRIKLISSTNQLQSMDEYKTDYPNSVDEKNIELESMNLVFDKIKESFEENNATITIHQYWTSIYTRTGHHGIHNHSLTFLEKVNYSGILYLTNLGSTNFYSTNPSSFEGKFNSKSEVGKILIFPSTIPHSVEPTYDDAKRVVVSFNCEIRNK